MRKIAALRSPAAVQELALVGFDRASVQNAASAIVASIGSNRAAAAQEIEKHSRRLSVCSWPDPGRRRLVKWIQLLDLEEPYREALLSVVACNADGHVREAAVRALSEGPIAELGVAILLIRCNDWVDSVRGVAQQALSSRLEPGHARSIAANAGNVAYLARCGRGNHALLIARIRETLANPDSRTSIDAVLDSSSDRETRRYLVDIALSANSGDSMARARSGLDDDDPVIRTRCYRHILQAQGGTEEDRRAAFHDPLAPIRIFALVSMKDASDPHLDDHFRQALFDRARSVRNLAIHHL